MASPVPSEVQSDIPARLDRLPWSAWHWRVVIALGIAWVLDGLEVTLVGSLAGMLERPDTLALSATQIGWAGSAYVGGAVAGALAFGRLADRLGRKRLFLATLCVYLLATLATAASFNFATFAVCRLLTGVGIGGEYAAINSAIDELIPARLRGRVSLAINGSFWIGAGIGALLSLPLLDTKLFAADTGWRMAFASGALLAVAILLVRRHVPESPRWLMVHGHVEAAQREIDRIEKELERQGRVLSATTLTMKVRVQALPSLREVARVLSRTYPARSACVLALMISQAFFYNAIFFTYSLVLTRFHGVAESDVGRYIFPFAVANFAGPLLLGPLFDRVGRRRMIASTYALSGLGLLLTGYGFMQGWLNAASQTLCWSAVFFVASAAASAAYLTASESFPLEMRALAISVFYAVGTATGGFLAPALFGGLIETGSRAAVFAGYACGALLVLVAAAIVLRFGLDAERKSLEEIAPPLASSA
jgi:MFS family permease